MHQPKKENNLDKIRHSLAHLLASAVLKKFPKARLGVGPVIDTGFYYDFKLPRPLSENEIQELENSMRAEIAENLNFRGEEVSPLKAKKMFKDQPFKLELIKDFIKEKKKLTAYQSGKFIDLCRGGHVKNTSEIDPDAFKLTKLAGAYWKGDEKNPQLTRIYGAAFNTKEELDNYLAQQEEARKRDHKKLGPELDLFTFSELVGAGLPLWTPKGTILRDILDNKVWDYRKGYGYERVDIPHITKKDLYEKSGHWDKFKEELFRIVTREGHEFAMKPMNCPHHTQIYARKQWSYRELPQRYASTTKVYRDEQSGELAGLSRTRAFTQDDAHVFCRESQMQDEIYKIWDIIKTFYSEFGFELKMRLSLHDPKNAKAYLGSPKIWKECEEKLRNILISEKADFVEAIGEAAFYGPKIDFLANDSLGREWQVATIQLDFNQPERFDLYCIDENGKKERIVMIHAAIMGSIERFMSILIEHYAGAFPFWLSPVQVKILSINDKVLDYVNEIAGSLKELDIRIETDLRNESVGKKIREAEMEKVPFIFIIGDKEAAQNKVAVRERGKGDIGQMTIEEFRNLAK